MLKTYDVFIVLAPANSSTRVSVHDRFCNEFFVCHLQVFEPEHKLSYSKSTVLPQFSHLSLVSLHTILIVR